MSVKVRIPPSPTGNLHLGNAYTFLFNYLFVKKNKGTLVLRFEDTDLERNRKEFEENIIDGLKWLGIEWNEGPFYQSKRLSSYEAARDKLLSSGKAYYCFCSKEELDKERATQAAQKLPQVYSGKCRNLSPEVAKENLAKGMEHVIRLKVPENRGEISWEDLIHGKTSFDSKLIGDIVILRSTGFPLYNFSVVIDDIDMAITHVLRGEDHLSNTPKQILIFEALGVSVPQFAHWPNILNPDRIGKLSKRENATAVTDYRKEGYLPEALANYLVLLGFTPPGEKELWSLLELEEIFDLSKMRKSAAAFDQNKLDWINGEYIRSLTNPELTELLENYLVDHPNKEKIEELTPLIKERIKKLSDFIPLTNFIFYPPEYDLSTFKKIKLTEDPILAKKVMGEILNKTNQLGSSWSQEDFEEGYKELAESLGVSNFDCFQLIRIMVSGQDITPPLFESIKIMGEVEAVKRMQYCFETFPNFPNTDKDLDIETPNK